MASRLSARPWWHAGLELAGLSAVAVTQPSFDVISRTPDFFTVRDADSWDVLLLAATLLLGVPLLALAVERLAAVASARLRAAVHLGFVWALVALIALRALKKLDGVDALGLSGWTLAVGAAALGLVAVAAYRRVALVSTFAAALSVAVPIVLAQLLATAPVGSASEPKGLHAARPVPIVMVVFDEFPTASLLDPRGRIDAGRVPNFAALARTSSWYRNTTTVFDFTPEAVSAILSGRRPERTSAPSAVNYPLNLFSALEGQYRLQASEPVTALCGYERCPRTRHRARLGRLADLTATAVNTSLHVVLPGDLAQRLPVVEGFADVGRAQSDFHHFLSGLAPHRRPTLYFEHVLTPHHPWHHLPSGARYRSPGQLVSPSGETDFSWSANPWLVQLGWQRHLSEVEFVDTLLGRLLRRLRREGLLDRSLLVITADHGVSFHAGGKMRWATRQNVGDIAPVPLFVKLPRQRTGRTVDAAATTLDILPTIAQAIGMRLPGTREGRPLATRARGPVSQVRVGSFGTAGVALPPAAVEAARAASVRRRLRLLGHDPLVGSGLGRGWARRLRGKGPAAVPGHPVRGTIDNAAELGHVDPASGYLPAFVTGSLQARPGSWVVLLVNGRVAAAAPLQPSTGPPTFAALIDPRRLGPGANRVRCYVVDPARVRALGG